MSRRADDLIAAVHYRALHDAWLQGSTRHWERRARAFDDAAPRAGDFLGRASAQDRLEQAIRCAETAEACRNRARLDELAVVEFHNVLTDTASGVAA